MSHVQGGIVTYSQNQWEAASLAIANFAANVTDPKASMYNAYSTISGVV